MVTSLIQEFGLTHEAMGEAVGKSRAHIGNILRLLRLPDRTKAAVRSGDLTFGHARALLGHPTPDALVDDVIARGMSVRQTEALVAKAAAPERETSAPVKDSDTVSVERKLTEVLGQRVEISVSRGRGSMRIHFTDQHQLEALIDRLAGG